MILNLLVCGTSVSQEVCYIHSGNQLFTLDINSCNKQLIGTTGPTLTDIAVTPSGTLYGIDFYNFYEVSTTNGSTTFISSIDALGSGFNSLIGFNDEYVLAVRTNGGLYSIHTSTGDTSLIGMLGYSPAGDITRYKEFYYMADAMNQLIRFKLDFTNNLISDIEVVGTMNTLDNAVFGIVTIGDASCEETSLQIIAFEGTTIYNVNPNNASCSVICPASSGINAFGAASSVETQPQILDGQIEMPNIFTPNGDGVNDDFEPLILLGISNLKIEILNRWGNLVYSNHSVNNFRWDGLTIENEMCSEGVYFYKIVCSDYCNKESIVTGFVQLVK